jgi:hypothetical protein
MDGVDVINDLFAQRRARNPAYSLRSFARDTGLSSGALSQIMTRKRPLTAKTSRRLADALGPAPHARRILVGAVSGSALAGDEARRRLDEDEFMLVAEPMHFVLLNLLRLDRAPREASEIATALRISPQEAAAALGRLARLGLTKVVSGRWRRTGAEIEFASPVASEAVRRFHAAALRGALAALDVVPAAERDVTTMYLPTSEAKLAYARERIATFLDELSRELETGPKEKVFQLSVQLFPLTRRSELPNKQSLQEISQ